MSHEHAGEKTEQATPRKLEEAYKHGQIARSAEVQTVFVLLAGMMALMFTGRDTWKQLVSAFVTMLGNLHEIPLGGDLLQLYGLTAVIAVARCVGPLLIAVTVAALLAGAVQNRFHTASEALEPNWGRLNPVEGLKRVFSIRSVTPAALALVKLGIILALTYSVVKDVLSDPIFSSSVSTARIAEFLAESSFKIVLRVGLVMAVLAVADYAYQFWRTNKDLMMTKQEVRDEMKSAEGNPQVKARQRKRGMSFTMRKMLVEVPKADVVVTNPTHLAVALRYDRKSMRAPRVVAKGTRLNALRIREVAARHQVPIIENKPLARLMFKHCRVGGEVPAKLYAAVAEVLAWVYRVNRYRYFAEQNRV